MNYGWEYRKSSVNPTGEPFFIEDVSSSPTKMSLARNIVAGNQNCLHAMCGFALAQQVREGRERTITRREWDQRIREERV